MELPEWVDIVKSVRFKGIPPYDPNWYYISADKASISKIHQCIGFRAPLFIFDTLHVLIPCSITFSKQQGIVRTKESSDKQPLVGYGVVLKKTKNIPKRSFRKTAPNNG
jgi:hypothetical protein